MTYTELYNEYHRAVTGTKIPLSYTRLNALREQLHEMKQVAYAELQEPGREILKAYALLNDKVKAYSQKLENDFETAHAAMKEIEAREYIDPITPEDDATANRQALLYIKEINRARGDTYAIQKVAERALTNRVGAMALLIADESTAISKQIPHSFITKAVEKAKSPEKLEHDMKRQADLEIAGKKCAELMKEGMRVRRIEQKTTQETVKIKGEISRSEPAFSHFKMTGNV